jgi:antitoxin component YwqK of YwqJK toxin-antitoxin module
MSKEKDLDVLVDVIKIFFPSFFYENGKKKLTYEIKDELEGLCLVTQWYENGQKDSDTNYKLYNSDATKALEDGLDPDFKKHGMETWWYENGKMKAEINHVDGKRNGSVIQYYENGQKEIEINYVDGKKDGLETQWYDNGKKKSEANYVDDKAKGMVTQWYENGQKTSEGNYINHQREGLATWWYESGQKYYEINYVDGKKEGLETHWDENGQKVAEINFKDDKQHGLQTIWDNNGVKISETEYKDGEKTGKDEVIDQQKREKIEIKERHELESEAKANGIYNIEDRHGKSGYELTEGQETALIRKLFEEVEDSVKLINNLKKHAPIFYEAYLDDEIAKLKEQQKLIVTARKFENIQTNKYLFKPEDSEGGMGTIYNFINGQEIPLIKEIFKVHPKPDLFKNFLIKNTPMFYKAYLDSKK